MTAYVDLLSIQTLNAGDVLTAALMQAIRNDLERLIDPPAASIFNNAAQTVGTGGGNTVLTANSENFDNDSMHSTSVNTSRITFNTAGRALLVSTTSFAADADGNRRVSFLHNGATSYGGLTGITDISNIGVRITAVRFLTVAVADYVEPTCQHTAGNNLGVTLEEFVAVVMTR